MRTVRYCRRRSRKWMRFMNLDDLVSKQISLLDVNDGYAALKDGSLNRVVVTSF